MTELRYNGSYEIKTLTNNCTGKCNNESRGMFKAIVQCDDLFAATSLFSFKLRAKLNVSGKTYVVKFRTDFPGQLSKGQSYMYLNIQTFKMYYDFSIQLIFAN